MSMCIVHQNPVVFSIHSRIKQKHCKIFYHNIRSHSRSLESVLCIILIDLSKLKLVMILSLVLISLYSVPISLQ